MAVTIWDDYLIHQTGETMDKVGTDNAHFMDRGLFFCHDKAGSINILAGLGTYPNANIMDGFFCVRRGEIQKNVRVSRYLNGDRANTQVGNFSLEVIEPLKRWRITLEENAHGLGGVLDFDGRGAPLMWPVFGIKENAQTHYDQAGFFSGHILWEGEKIPIDRFVGGRDRSWGVRRPGMFQMFDVYFWIFAHFEDFTLSVMHLDMLDGTSIMRRGTIEKDDGTVIPIEDVRHDIKIHPHDRTIGSMALLLTDATSETHRVNMTSRSTPFFMAGPGYDDRHGQDRGPSHIDGETWTPGRENKISFPFSHYYQTFGDVDMDGEKGVAMVESLFGASKDWKYTSTIK